MAKLLSKAISISLVIILFGSVWISADEPGNTEDITEVLPSEEGSTEGTESSKIDGTEILDHEATEVQETQTDYSESLKAINDKLYFIACTLLCGVLFNALAFMFDCFGKLIIGGKHD